MSTDEHGWGRGKAAAFAALAASVVRVRLCPSVVFVLLLFLTGCERAGTHQPADAGAGHAHAAPHGGTLVQLGDHEFNLELVAGPEGVLNAYVLDAHAENFVRIIAPSFKVTARVGDRDETLEFKAVASAASGEAVGSTSAFQAQAEWLKTTASFDGVLQELAVKGTLYRSIPFKFSKSN